MILHDEVHVSNGPSKFDLVMSTAAEGKDRPTITLTFDSIYGFGKKVGKGANQREKVEGYITSIENSILIEDQKSWYIKFIPVTRGRFHKLEGKDNPVSFEGYYYHKARTGSLRLVDG